MTPRKRIISVIAPALALSAVFVLAACGKLDDTVNTAQKNIEDALKAQNVYERDNLPDPAPAVIAGRFEITEGGAYRYVVNEDREEVNKGPEIGRGDSIAFMFDARIFTRGNFENQQTFYTNIEARIREITNNNPDFDSRFWTTSPLRIKVGEDPGILKSLQEALIKCRAGDGDPSNDDEDGAVASDRVRVYLTPDIAFGSHTVYDVPGGSTLVFEVTDIEIIK